MISKIQNQNNLIFLILTATLTFLTWYFNINEVYNVLIYSSLLILLAVFKASDIKLVIFTLFTIAGNREPGFLKLFDSIYSNIFGSNISALKSYYTFLYTAIFIILIIILLIRSIKNKRKLTGRLVIPMIIIIVYSLITLIWTPNINKGLSEFWFIIQGYFIYVIVRNDNEEANYYGFSWILSILLLVISLQYFVSYREYFQVHELDYNFFTYFKFPSKEPIQLWANPNIVASVFSVAYAPSLFKYFTKNKSKLRFLFIPMDILILYAIVLTKSSGLHFALAAGLISIPVLFVRNKKTLYIVLITMMTAFILSITLVVLLEPELYDIVNTLTTKRLDIYKIAINTLKDPLVFLFGNGIGSDREVLANVHFFHSFVFQVLVNRGLVTLTIIAFMFYKIIEILFESKSKFRYFIALASVTYLAHGITDSGFEYQYIGVIFFVLISLVEKEKIVNNNMECFISREALFLYNHQS